MVSASTVVDALAKHDCHWAIRDFDAIDLDRLTAACVCQIFVGDLADLVCWYVSDTFRPVRRVFIDVLLQCIE